MWKNRNVWIVLVGEFIVGLGLWAGIIGNLSFMKELVPSDFHKSLILAIGMLAGLVVGPLAGKMIDIKSKKSVIIWASITRIVAVLFMFAAISYNSIVLMIIFLVIIQIAASFYMPALQAVIPLIVSKEDLLAMNGWNMNARTLSRIVGTAAAGLLVSYVDLIWLYVISLVMYVAMLGAACLLNFEERKMNEKANREKSSFKEVLPILKQHPTVMATLVLIVVPVLFLGSFNLVIINVAEMHQSDSISGLIYTVEGLGFMLGAFMLKKIGQHVKVGTILFTVALVVGILQLALVFSHIIFVPVVVFALFGFAVGCFFPTTMTIFQKQVPNEYHGRFFAFRNMIDQVLFQIVLLSTGALLDLVGLQVMGVLFGLLSISLTLFFMTYLKKKNGNLTFE